MTDEPMHFMEYDVQHAMLNRHAVRQYTPEPLTAEEKALVKEYIGQVNALSGLDMKLVSGSTNQLDEFLDSISHYGRFSNVTDCIEISAPATDAGQRMAGYYGEMLVLRLAAAGFDTSWVGGSITAGATTIDLEQPQFDGSTEELSIQEEATFRLVIVVGYAARPGHPHKSKPVEELCELNGMPLERMPAWFQQGIAAVQLAPSALNKQTFRFELLPNADPKTGLPVVRGIATEGLLAQANLGVAELHFTLGAGATNFVWE